MPRVLTIIATSAAVLTVFTPETALAQSGQSHKKPKMAAAQAAGPNSVSQDIGNVAVLVDNGLMVTSRNLFDLNGTAVQLSPAGAQAYSVVSFPGLLDPAYGSPLTFGHPEATQFPGDDDAQRIPFAAGFPFFGTVYTDVWVNTDGNVTFGQPEFASDDRDRSKHVLGPPRISAYLFDVNAHNALNPAGSGSIHAAVKTGPDRLVVTWNEVGDFVGGISSTFQLTLYSTGVAVVSIDHIDPAVAYGVIGIAPGGGQGPFNNIDFSAPPASATAGAVMEQFATYTQLNTVQTAREFYKSHTDEFDFLVCFTAFPADGCCYSTWISNQTHGISTPLNPSNGQPIFSSTVFDRSALWGSAGELEQVLFLANVPELAYPTDLVNPVVDAYSPSLNVLDVAPASGWPVTLDGQTMAYVRRGSNLLPDDGEFSRLFPRPNGTFWVWVNSPMSVIAHEALHRWGTYLRFDHPITGREGLDSYDLLGRDLQHWSYFMNSAVPAAQFGGAPRASVMEGNALIELGPIANYNGTATNLAPGESVFMTATNELMDGFNALDQYVMGLRRGSDAGSFWYVDDPKSIYTGASLDVFNPANPLASTDTMRVWLTQGGIVFKGRRVDLALDAVRSSEKDREGNQNPQGKRFWGPKNNLTVRYSSSTRLVDPNGDASVVLSASDRELGDEADMIDLAGKPVDVKTMAFVLVVKSGQPSSYLAEVGRLDDYRQTWEAYGNGIATGGRGRFDTRLSPPVH